MSETEKDPEKKVNARLTTSTLKAPVTLGSKSARVELVESVILVSR